MADDTLGHGEDDRKPGLTIEQFAAETGTSVRTIRSYRSRHLLPPPEMREGVGYYGDEHVARIRRIVELQAQGLKLSEIEQQLAGRRPSLEQLAELTRVIVAPFEPDSPEVLTLDELTRLVGPLEEQDIDTAQDLGLLVPAGNRTFEAPSPMLLRAVAQAAARGVPVATGLSIIEEVRRNCELISKSFVQLFVDYVWTPFDKAGTPPDRYKEVTEAIEQLRSLAAEVVLAVFRQTMEAEVENAFGEIVEELATRGRQPGS